MAIIDYSRCDCLVPITEPVVDSHYKVNLLHSYEMEYRANLSKRDRVIGGKNLPFIDGGANGVIIGLDMKILYFNPDGRQVIIGIVGDHQLTGNRLCYGCSVAKSNLGWIKLLWPQGAQVKTQQNLILSVIQMRDHECVVNDVAKAHGGKQMMLTPGGVQLPFIIKHGLPYLGHYYLTERQLDEITRKEFMTSRNTLDPTKLDSPERASGLMISQLSPIPMIKVDTEIGPVSGDSKVDSKVYSVIGDSKVDPAVVENDERYCQKHNGKKIPINT